ncbi:MAG TPA: choice-of-anchor L domain-containing protein [Polyangiaceae bacterium]|nr:choice-of-anchor L domain-containing protein [Polyangiaceae bacterium]
MKSHKLVSLLVLVLACSSKSSEFGDGGGGGNDGGNDGGPITTSDGGCVFCGVDGSSGGDGSVPCVPNPANYDIPGNGCDDDGDGKVDNVAVCDSSLPATGTAMQMAQAMGLCQQASSSAWGVVSATFTQGYGNSTAPDAHQTSILGTFGNALKPREGGSFGILSSGYAQASDSCPTNQRYQGMAGTSFKYGCAMTGQGAAPSGFPKSATGCPSQQNEAVNDVVDLQLKIKVPANANGFSFDFDFGSGEWPEFVCSPFNDAFIAYLKSAAFNNGTPDNISFDSKNNPVSVNNGFFSECGPANAATGCNAQATPGTAACTGGTTNLVGTGFYDLGDQSACATGETGGGMTGWLTTQAPAQPSETITIDLIIWDTGDQFYDSSVILDNWTWKPHPVAVSTQPN